MEGYCEHGHNIGTSGTHICRDLDSSWNWVPDSPSITGPIKRKPRKFTDGQEEPTNIQENITHKDQKQEIEKEDEELAEIKRRHQETREAIKQRYTKITGKKKTPKSPFGLKLDKSFRLGIFDFPFVSTILITGVFLVIISLTTPFWACVEAESISFATFGLWHFCIDNACWSIRDNLVRGHDIPLWYMVSQMTFTIGVICATLAMFVVASNHKGNKVKMSPTLNSTMVMMLVVGVLQMSTSLYTFTSYFEDVSFLYEYSEEVNLVDFYGSFWCGVIGVILIFIAALILFFDEEIMPYPSTNMKPHLQDPNNPLLNYPWPYPDGHPYSYAEDNYYPIYDNYYRDNPDNALFKGMALWDEQYERPILTQEDLPYLEHPLVKFPGKIIMTSEEYIKKST